MFKKDQVFYYADITRKVTKVLIAEDQKAKDVVHSPLTQLLVCDPVNKKDRYYVDKDRLYHSEENATERARLEKAIFDLKAKDIVDAL